MKTFRSMNQIDKHFFPKNYKKQIEEKAIKEQGIGTWLAKRFLAGVKRALKTK